ncbi:hypothetical protein OIU84_004032 [Salix udensis]|uniref:Uncharacterized protein n=1 Tax=Salix udensis TaxID=889485 RepID=A0AAD6K3F0_9ROSI|nr:hypothetical protein OIU84_004032 [Salix udensis]
MAIQGPATLATRRTTPLHNGRVTGLKLHAFQEIKKPGRVGVFGRNQTWIKIVEGKRMALRAMESGRMVAEVFMNESRNQSICMLHQTQKKTRPCSREEIP